MTHWFTHAFVCKQFGSQREVLGRISFLFVTTAPNQVTNTLPSSFPHKYKCAHFFSGIEDQANFLNPSITLYIVYQFVPKHFVKF